MLGLILAATLATSPQTKQPAQTDCLDTVMFAFAVEPGYPWPCTQFGKEHAARLKKARKAAPVKAIPEEKIIRL